MYLVRPVDFADLPALERLAQQAGIGITNFPANRDRLNDKIASSRRSMQQEVIQPGEESYCFVLVNTSNDEIVGVCGIDAMVGTDAPFYSYRIDDVVHASPQLQIHNRIPALFLCHDYSGTSRLVALIVEQKHQNHETMSLLSRARLLFIAQHQQRFTPKLFVELRGESDASGYSPFWDSLGKYFFSMDFQKADYLSGVSNKHFIADLMPRYPIYVPTLPDAAQQVIGVVHEDSEKASDILLDEGFAFKGYVDIFDAGPSVEARTCDLRTISESKQSRFEAKSENSNASLHIIASGQLEDFKVTLANASYQTDSQVLSITPEVQKTLNMQADDDVNWVPI